MMRTRAASIWNCRASATRWDVADRSSRDSRSWSWFTRMRSCLDRKDALNENSSSSFTRPASAASALGLGLLCAAAAAAAAGSVCPARVRCSTLCLPTHSDRTDRVTSGSLGPASAAAAALAAPPGAAPPAADEEEEDEDVDDVDVPLPPTPLRSSAKVNDSCPLNSSSKAACSSESTNSRRPARKCPTTVHVPSECCQTRRRPLCLLRYHSWKTSIGRRSGRGSVGTHDL
mmetsp:Transcript_19331/g.74142  ORF Transcript_19331/g.74142 Transcript_19331/m.74142 type:complete len:231 (-) Transcript_19331:974-1666(-)